MKTIKDIKTKIVEIEAGCFEHTKYPIIEVKELKDVAREWIKELERPTIEEDHEEFIANGYTIRWIKHFFNLEEE